MAPKRRPTYAGFQSCSDRVRQDQRKCGDRKSYSPSRKARLHQWVVAGRTQNNTDLSDRLP
ncbi:hypothetical protein BaRGS_00017034, partial [Batillaria attramentaria]